MRFTSQSEPGFEQASPSPDWSDLDSRLREIAKLSSALSSEQSSNHAVEPHVTLAHDPHDPLALLEQFNAQYRTARQNPLPQTEVPAKTNPSPLDERAGSTAGHRNVDRKPDPLDMLSLLAGIPSRRA